MKLAQIRTAGHYTCITTPIPAPDFRTVSMLVDDFGRTINYLRISVTDRCNFRCTYCMPPQGVKSKPRDQILSLEKLASVARAAGGLGFTKVRITGGEPLVRADVEVLVGHLSDCGFFGDISMATNGALLTPEKARTLQSAGLQRINISLDTLDPEAFSRITCGGEVAAVIRGIDAALDAGLLPVKINMVVFDTTTPEEILRMKTFCTGRGCVMQTIRHFQLGRENPFNAGEITADRPHRCGQCNRIRLTADGYLRSCLHSGRENKVDFGDLEGSLRKAVMAKPESGAGSEHRVMSQIGG